MKCAYGAEGGNQKGKMIEERAKRQKRVASGHHPDEIMKTRR